MTDKLNFKKRMLLHCMQSIQQRIDAALMAMDNAQAAANSEEKSSAGDKYETGRAMSHLEKDMHARQLVANQHELAALKSVDCSRLHVTVTAGSVVVCDDVKFFIAAGLGKIVFEGETILVLSPNAPVAKLLLRQVAGGSCSFNSKTMLIKDVF
ncbi:hypothetical protein [Ferruginibacter sp.]|uniref:hypothetical protein n=1 Tax=Ferruginibacter sp. TaxID=1940288 RepID=UPI002657D2D7|nr:hypothetical protein [Ferruginibacter sp.]